MTTPTPSRSGKINSVLSVFESTIQKNAESGENCGMYLTNKVGKKKPQPTTNGGGAGALGSSDSPPRQRPPSSSSSRRPPPDSEAKRAAQKLRKRRDNMNNNHPNNATTSSSNRQRSGGGDGKIPATLQLDSLTPAHSEKSGSGSRKQHTSHKTTSGNSALTESTAELSVEDLELEASAPSSGHWNSFDDSINMFSEAEESSHAPDGDNDDDFSLLDESSFQEPEWNPEVKEKKKKKKDPHWANSFAVTYQQRSEEEEAEESDADIGSSNKQKHQRRPRHKPNKSSGAADDNNNTLRRSSSARSLQKQSSNSNFAIAYQVRNNNSAEESDSDFDPEEARNKIRNRHASLQKEGSNLHDIKDLKRSNSARNLQKSSVEEFEQDMNHSFRSVNSRSKRCSTLKQQQAGAGLDGTDAIRNMIMGGSCSALGFGGSSSQLMGLEPFESDASDSERGRRRSSSKTPSKSRSHPKSRSPCKSRSPSKQRQRPPPQHADEYASASESDTSAFSSSSRRSFKAALPVRKYGAGAGDMSALPPAFQTIARSNSSRPVTNRPKRPTTNSAKHEKLKQERKQRPPTSSSSQQDGDSGDEMDKILSFKSDRSFFDKDGDDGDFHVDTSLFDQRKSIEDEFAKPDRSLIFDTV